MASKTLNSLKKVFIVKDNTSGLYFNPDSYSRNSINGWLSDIEEARVYFRKCDAKNSLRMHGYRKRRNYSLMTKESYYGFPGDEYQQKYKENMKIDILGYNLSVSSDLIYLERI